MLYQPQIECSEEELHALALRGLQSHEERTALLVAALRHGRVGGRVAVYVGGRWRKMLRVYYSGRLAALCVDLEHARATLVELERASRDADDMARAYGCECREATAWEAP